MYNIKLMRICLKVAKRLHETVQLDTNVDLTTNKKELMLLVNQQ